MLARNGDANLPILSFPHLLNRSPNKSASCEEKEKVLRHVLYDAMNNRSETRLLAEVLVPLFLNDVDTCPLNMCSPHDRFIGRTTNIT